MIDDGAKGIVELAESYRSGRLSPVTVVERALAHQQACEPALNAWATVLAEEAREAALDAERAFVAGHDTLPLQGVPVALKDLIAVRGVVNRFGAPATGRSPEQSVRPAGTPPEEWTWNGTPALHDAALVSRLREAGAIVLGTTNLLEFAYGVAHPEVGQTNNPHDPSRTAGGSSGGSAASVAAGTVPLAIGTDTGGSIRIPASYCGVVGFKPSFALVPTDGVHPLSPSLDHAGPLARSVRDVTLATDVLAGGLPTVDARPVAALRIGIVTEHVDSPLVIPGVRACLDAAIECLGAAGAALARVSVTDAHATNRALVRRLMPEASLVHADRHARDAARYAPRTRAQIEAGFEISAVDWLRAGERARELGAHVARLFERVDVLLGPSVPFVAPREDPAFTDDEEDAELLSAGLANLLGLPAISLPCGTSGGLPVGLQLIGSRDADGPFLAAAESIEAVVRRPGSR